MKFLSPIGGLAIAEGATTPTGTTGTVLWSTTALKWLYWSGTAWTASASGGAGSGNVDGGTPTTIYGGSIVINGGTP